VPLAEAMGVAVMPGTGRAASPQNEAVVPGHDLWRAVQLSSAGTEQRTDGNRHRSSRVRRGISTRAGRVLIRSNKPRTLLEVANSWRKPSLSKTPLVGSSKRA
jgi:hypothetical protein